MKKTLRRTLLDDAGRLYLLKKQLDDLCRERDSLDHRIARAESRVAEAQQAFDSVYQRVAGSAANGHLSADAQGDPAESLAPGKLPRRVWERMQQAPSQIFTAADLKADLEVSDIQQVRTALARLAGKGLVRRTNAKGEFTI